MGGGPPRFVISFDGARTAVGAHSVVTSLVENYAGQITSIITDTVARWDADEASDKIELAVGRDLQFIRINGTVVGSIAGLVIYSITQIFF